MNRHNLFHRIAGTIGFCFLLLSTGCSNESEDRHGYDTKPVPVTVSLSAESLPGTSTKSNTAEVITPDDRINTLDLYIINSNNQIEKHLTKADFTLNEASNGGTTSATIELMPGVKQVYAFSNCGNDAFASLGLETEWTVVPPTVLNNECFVITEAINKENGIPLSAQTNWEINSNTSNYQVTLVRMVGKMSVRLIDERKASESGTNNAAITSLRIEDLLPNKTHLFRTSKGAVTLPTDVTKKVWSVENPQTVATTEAETPYLFYLHETQGSFTVKLQIAGETDGDKDLPRLAVLDRVIPRNHYFPLNIYLRDFTLDIEGTYEYAPIGVLPIQKEIAPTGYEITLPEGSSNIQLKVRLKEGTETILHKDVNWEENKITSNIPGFEKTIADANAPEVEQDALLLSIPALPAEASTSQTIHIQLEHANRELEFTLTLKTRALEGDDLTRAGFTGSDQDVITIEL